MDLTEFLESLDMPLWIILATWGWADWANSITFALGCFFFPCFDPAMDLKGPSLSWTPCFLSVSSLELEDDEKSSEFLD